MSLVVQDPLSNRAAVLARDEFWLLEFLDLRTVQTGTRDELVAAAHAFCSLPEPAVESTLHRLWNIVFVDENTGSMLDRSLETWERYDCKLAFEFVAQSLDESDRPRCADLRKVCVGSTPAGRMTLPAPAEFPRAALSSVLYNRRTCREFNGNSIPLPVLSSLLYHGLACVPEEVAVRPVLHHLIVLRAEPLAPGSYAYTPASHDLTALRLGGTAELESDLVQMLIGQAYVQGCAFALLLSMDIGALFAEDPRPSALRRCLIRTGVLAQRLILFGVAHGLQTFLSAAIHDRNACGISCNHIGEWYAPMHCLAFGYSGPDQAAVTLDKRSDPVFH